MPAAPGDILVLNANLAQPLVRAERLLELLERVGHAFFQMPDELSFDLQVQKSRPLKIGADAVKLRTRSGATAFRA